MSAPSPSPADLEAYLQEVRHGEDRTSTVRHDGRSVCYNPSACEREDALQFAKLARRPPPGMTIFKHGSRSVVGAYRMSNDRAVALKYYYPRNALKKLRYGLFGSRCRISWIGSLGLTYLGLPTPLPLAMSERPGLGGIVNHESFLATACASGKSLGDLVAEHGDEPDRFTTVAKTLKEVFDTMARYRISHGDLKSTNIFVDSEHRVSFLDLDAVSFLNPPSRWARLRAADRDNFLSNWTAYPALAELFKPTLT